MLKNGRTWYGHYCSCCSPKRDRRKHKHMIKRQEERAWKKEFDVA